MIGEPRCPRCGSTVLGPCDVWLEASDERVQATHECGKCSTRFRFTPPAERPAPRSKEVAS